jgi:integrase
MERLTAKRAETLRKPGRHMAADTLFLTVTEGRTGRINKRWVQRLHVNGKRRDIGIGTYPAVTLSEARERAHDNRMTAKRGGDPTGRASTVPTFAAVSEKVDQGGQWRGRTRETRRRTLDRYAGPLMGRPVDQIDRAAVLAVLGPVYATKPATGKLLRGWVRGVLAAAQALGHVDVNPAGEVIDAALPKTPKTREHRRALPYAGVPAALEAVEASGAGPVVKAAISFTALTAVRSGEARGATWGEVDLEAREWRVPASRMKGGVEHRVPLSDAAVAILEGMRVYSDGAPGSLVFAGVAGRPSTATPSSRRSGARPGRMRTFTASVVRSGRGRRSGAARLGTFASWRLRMSSAGLSSVAMPGPICSTVGGL